MAARELRDCRQGAGLRIHDPCPGLSGIFSALVLEVLCLQEVPLVSGKPGPRSRKQSHRSKTRPGHAEGTQSNGCSRITQTESPVVRTRTEETNWAQKKVRLRPSMEI